MNHGLKLLRHVYKQPLIRSYSSQLPTEWVFFQDRNLIICWHPEQPFPYEYSKPIPVKESKPEGVLKVGEKEVKAMFKKPKQELIPEELARITYTCKNRWYPRSRDLRAKKTKPDRPYL